MIKNPKGQSQANQKSRFVPPVKAQPAVNTDFDEEVDLKTNLRSPQINDYQTMEPISGDWSEGTMETGEGKISGNGNEITADDISYMLSRHPEIDASDILIRVNEGEVVLSGTVPEERMKFMTAEVIKLIHGVKSVQNQLKYVRAQ